MKKHHVDLATLMPHSQAKIRITGEVADVWTTHSITSVSFNLYGDSFKKHYVSLPEKYHLPFCLDMTVKLDFPALILFIGNGHITFASPWQDNRKIGDIVKPDKLSQDQASYNNSLPFNEFVDISVIYNFDEMQILIGGKERFYSHKQAYMKEKIFNESNTDGFSIGFAVSKLSTVSVKSITVTEFDGRVPVIRGENKEIKHQPAENEHSKITFENVILKLSKHLQNEIIEMDHFLKSLRPLKFKRIVDKSSNKITYVSSDFGVSYVLNISGAQSSHNFGWYIIHNGKPETWHRKADDMEETLNEIKKFNPQLAERIFYSLNDCVNCHGSDCLDKTLYKFNGQQRLTCKGRVVMRICRDDFNDVREFFRFLNLLLERKIDE